MKGHQPIVGHASAGILRVPTGAQSGGCHISITSFANATDQSPNALASGHRYTPRIRALTGAAAPTHIGPGQSMTVRLDTVLPTGAGEVVWTTNGAAPLVSYEFVTEID